jgi:hypothetical protein
LRVVACRKKEEKKKVRKKEKNIKFLQFLPSEKDRKEDRKTERDILTRFNIFTNKRKKKYLKCVELNSKNIFGSKKFKF